MDKFVLFAFLLFTAIRSNSSVNFLGESTARQSAFRFYLTFRVGRRSAVEQSYSGDGGICGYGETRVLETIRQLHGVFFSFEGQKPGY